MAADNPKSVNPATVPDGAMDTVPFSEDALALLFAERFDGTVRYVSAVSTRHKWFVWNAVPGMLEGGEWQADCTLLVLDHIREICREAATCGDNNPTLARELVSANFISGVERLARSDRRVAATKTQVGLPKRKAARKAVQP